MCTWALTNQVVFAWALIPNQVVLTPPQPPQMASSSATKLVLPVLLVLSSCLSLSRCAEEPNCPPLPCGKLGSLGRPFVSSPNTDCGYIIVQGCDQTNQSIQLQKGSGKWYDFLEFSLNDSIVHLRDPELDRRLRSSDQCQAVNDSSLPQEIRPTITLLKCEPATNLSLSQLPHSDFHYRGCKEYDIYYNQISKPPPPLLLPSCTVVQLPVANNTVRFSNDLFGFLVSDFFLRGCSLCLTTGRSCEQDKQGDFVRCATITNKGGDGFRLRLAIGLGSGGAAIVTLMICSVLVVVRGCQRKKNASSVILSPKNYTDRSLKSEFETQSTYFGVPIFQYRELEEATNFFDSTKELGDGAFGAVYYGKLRDGREVAVKRLYENNRKRVEQFMNEIKILTQLRHENLVTLYGCTSRHSRELLLVYEFIANGTVADHLHGDRATPTPLSWPVRLRIAYETANALTYLHGCGIIHRDVKTNNILLDNNFSVKVADFGLSRLFPTDATHVSTAPQGTPGYVDPEYHRCYQLTEKSDVYSFGVVLIELVSSLPAVDISREEINLADMAVSKIQKREFGEFLDPCLRFESDLAVRRMMILVAELAFQCLQTDRERRPSMEEVLKILKSVRGEHDSDDDDKGTQVPLTGVVVDLAEPEDDGVSLKSTHLPDSPISVTDEWVGDASPASR